MHEQSRNNIPRDSTTAGDLPTKERVSKGRGTKKLAPVRSAELLSLAAAALALSGGLLARWLASPKQPGHRTLGQITAAMNGSTALASAAGMIDAVRRDWTARRNRGVLSRFCACHVCLVCGLWMGSVRVVRALWRLLRWLKLKQIPSVFCDSLRIPLSHLLSSSLLCVLLPCNSLLHQPALFRHRHRP